MKLRRIFENFFFFKILYIIIAVFILGCASQSIVPFETGQDINQLTETESRLWNMGFEFDESLLKSDQLYKYERLQAYLQSIMDSLYKEFNGIIRVQILKSPILNAFALPHGSVYIHIGLLARLDNEAQIATVLAHEAAHFTQKHSLRKNITIKSGTAFSNIVALTGIPLFGDLLAASSITGFSRELEREADRIGFERLIAAGYETSESVKVFEYLADEVQTTGIKEPFFFASHPKLKERIKNYREFEGEYENTAGKIASAAYLEETKNMRLDNLYENLSRGRYKYIIYNLENEAIHSRYPLYVHYFLGEAYRLRGGIGDNEKAIHNFEKAIQNAPNFAASYKAIGIQYYKQNDKINSLLNLQKYLQLSPDARDRSYIEQYVNELDKMD